MKEYKEILSKDQTLNQLVTIFLNKVNGFNSIYIKSYKMNYAYKIKKDELIKINNRKDKRENSLILKVIDKPYFNNHVGAIVIKCVVVLSSVKEYNPGDSINISTYKPNIFGIMIHEIVRIFFKLIKLKLPYKLQL